MFLGKCKTIKVMDQRPTPQTNLYFKSQSEPASEGLALHAHACIHFTVILSFTNKAFFYQFLSYLEQAPPEH